MAFVLDAHADVVSVAEFVDEGGQDIAVAAMPVDQDQVAGLRGAPVVGDEGPCDVCSSGSPGRSADVYRPRGHHFPPGGADPSVDRLVTDPHPPLITVTHPQT